MGLAATLWRANDDLAQAALAHRFVRGLADGTLPRPAFQAYVAQDAFFLEAFARAYALALAHSPDHEAVRTFFDLLVGVMDELKLHAGYAARWEIDLHTVTPREATLAYTDFLLATASLGGVGLTCAAMTPCMRLYAFLGQTLAGQAAPDTPYQEWIATYADPAFEALAARLEGLLDRYAGDTLAVRAAYRRAMRLEVSFFDAHAG
jgi:thiaminase/transcriptional activator TenA